MAVRLRLKRLGARHRPFYRIIAADSKSPRDGRFIETIGTYNPLTDPSEIKVKSDRLAYWLSVGALPTDSVKRLLKTGGYTDEKGKPKAQPAGVEETPSE